MNKKDLTIPEQILAQREIITALQKAKEEKEKLKSKPNEPRKKST